MDPEAASLYAIHIVFAGLWTGSVAFLAWAVVPAAIDGSLNAEPLSALTDRFKLLSRASAIVLPLTGLRMAMIAPFEYTSPDLLFGTTQGYLLVGMITLWLVLMGLVEVGASKLLDGTSQQKVREPARNARPFFLAASVVAVLLLIDAGLLLAVPL